MTKKLLILLALAISAYPLEVSARDLVRVGENSQGVSYYVWRDSIRKKGNIVWWRDESVRYDANGVLDYYFVTDNSGDCRNMASRVQKSYDSITGEQSLKSGRLLSYTPGSTGFFILEYVCSQK
jgi:hypothetical protein